MFYLPFARHILLGTLAALALANSLASAAPPASEPKPIAPVWLSDLPEKNVAVGYGSFGKNGWAGFEPVVINTRGYNSLHGLGMHPDAHVEYQLDGKYRTFRAGAAMNYSCGEGCARPVIFRVLLDGKLAWESLGMHFQNGRQQCLLDITGTRVLRLEVLYRPGAKGDGSRAHGVWIDPYVAVDPPSPRLLPLFDPEKYRRSERTQEFINHVKDLVTHEQFDELEKLAQHCRETEEFGEGDPMLSWFYSGVVRPWSNKEDPYPDNLARLERWKKAKPDSLTAMLAIAITYSNYAWAARGHGFAGEVTEEGGKLYHERLAKGKKYLDEAMEKKLADGALYATTIEYELDSDVPRDKLLDFLRRGKNLPKRYYPIYAALANYLLPRWHGAQGELQETALAFREMLKGELGDEVYFRMACTELETLDENFFKQTDYNYDFLKAGFRVALRDFPECDNFVNDACLLACLQGDKETARQLFQRLDASSVDADIWKTPARYQRWRRKVGAQLEPAEEKLVLDDPGDSVVVAVAFAGDKQLLTASEGSGIRRWDHAGRHGRRDDRIRQHGAPHQLRRNWADGGLLLRAASQP